MPQKRIRVMDQSYQLALPSLCCNRMVSIINCPVNPKKLESFLQEVEHFAMNEYAQALNQKRGSLLDSTAFNSIAEKLHNYTGLPVAYIKKANLRITGPQFEQTLLSNEK